MSWFKFGFGKKKKDKVEEAPADEAVAEDNQPEADPALDDDATDIGAATKREPEPETEPDADDSSEDDGPGTDEVALGPDLPDEAFVFRESRDQDDREEQAPLEAAGLTHVEPDIEVEAEPEAAPNDGVSESSEKKGFFARIASGLKKTSSRFSDSVSAVFTQRKLDNEALEELEDLLIAADLGAATA